MGLYISGSVGEPLFLYISTTVAIRHSVGDHPCAEDLVEECGHELQAVSVHPLECFSWDGVGAWCFVVFEGCGDLA